jgi:murein DD-endopeptidase MepM/ murein hydrolase activator NlpD
MSSTRLNQHAERVRPFAPARQRSSFFAVAIAGLLFALSMACAASTPFTGPATLTLPPPPLTLTPQPTQTAVPEVTPFPTRPLFDPGELVEYLAQTGDTLPSIALRFNTTVEEIRLANTFIPDGATTMPPGMPMQIPVYYLPFWGSPYQIVPDSHFVNGPATLEFDTPAFVAAQPGWLFNHNQFVAGQTRNGAGIVDFVATNFSINPMLLLAILEYQTGALSQPAPPANIESYPLGFEVDNRQGLYLQLVLAANALNNAYYAWRAGDLLEFELTDGRIERPDPWQNAATVSLQAYFAGHPPNDYAFAISEDGLALTYASLFENPWAVPSDHIPGSLRQPEFILPFEPGTPWTYTGGPHTGWGIGPPRAALDFAPPVDTQGCVQSNDWVTAVADGLVVREDVGQIMLDLDGDGDERTGWNVLYLHIESRDRIPVGAQVKQGDRLGHPSCEGGTSTGTHIHVSRKYNGEWVLAEGPVAFNMEGWIAFNGDIPYQGTLQRFTDIVIACTCSNQASQITRQD